MGDYTCVVILGRITRDPELKYAPNGAPVCSFSLAVNHRYTKSDGEKASSVTFVDVDVWRRLAEICAQFLKKGRQVLVSGSLKQDRWTDAKTQQQRSKLKVLANDVTFVGPKPGEDDADGESAEEPEPARESS